MRRIDFLIVGVQKAGTTSLDAYLRQHPQIAMAKRKEIHFFDKRPPTGVRALDYKLYHRQFDWAAQARGARLGEATPIYTWWHGALDRIKAYSPHIQLITFLRNPIDRAFSQHQMDVRLSRRDEAFSEAIRTEYKTWCARPDEQHRERSLISRGMYAPQIEKLKSLFPDEQLLFLRSANLAARPQQVLDRVCRFLGVDDYEFSPEPAHNRGDGAQMSETDREFLVNVFREDVTATRDLLGWSAADWSL